MIMGFWVTMPVPVFKVVSASNAQQPENKVLKQVKRLIFGGFFSYFL